MTAPLSVVYPILVLFMNILKEKSVFPSYFSFSMTLILEIENWIENRYSKPNEHVCSKVSAFLVV